jgi:predicted Fe-Mo cluster-binding NifX family protein
MRAAVPMFEENVAPRFGFADRFLIGDIDQHKVVHAEEVCIAQRGWPARLEAIRQLGVETLLCCGFNRHYLPLCDTLGVRVITGLSGDGRELLEKFARDCLPRMPGGSPCPGGGRGRGRGRGGRCEADEIRGSRGGGTPSEDGRRS